MWNLKLQIYNYAENSRGGKLKIKKYLCSGEVVTAMDKGS